MSSRLHIHIIIYCKLKYFVNVSLSDFKPKGKLQEQSGDNCNHSHKRIKPHKYQLLNHQLTVLNMW